jgi:hypothetical protein
MITAAQIRAARALIGWTAVMLAERAHVGYQTVQRAENAEGVPKTTASNLFAIQRALEDGGVVFLEDGDIRSGGVGVRLKGT